MKTFPLSEKQTRYFLELAKNSKSGFIGVSWYEFAQKWKASIMNQGQVINIGLFDNPVDAAIARDNKAVELWGINAVTNDKLGLFKEADRAIWLPSDPEKVAPIYRIWHGMKKRCNARNNKEAKNYGDKGISYDASWESYLVFRIWALENNYSDTLTLDRIDCFGDYTPENCRWVDMKIQQNNRSNTVYVEYNGEIVPRAILASKLGLTNQGLIYRLKHNIPLDAPKKKFVKEEDL